MTLPLEFKVSLRFKVPPWFKVPLRTRQTFHDADSPSCSGAFLLCVACRELATPARRITSPGETRPPDSFLAYPSATVTHRRAGSVYHVPISGPLAPLMGIEASKGEGRPR